MGRDCTRVLTDAGGSVGDLDASGSSTITMTGGSVRGELGPFDTSSVSVHGGTALANVHAEGSATLTILGGTFTGSNLSIGSGSSSASINLQGGAGWAGNVEADSGSITIFGHDFQVGWLPGVADGPTLAFSTVPEPGTGLFVMAGVVGLAVRRRRARGASRGSASA